MSKKIIFSSLGVLILAGGFIFISRQSKPEPPSDPITSGEEAQYLAFFLPLEGIFEASTKEQTFAVIDERAADLAERVGATGDGKTRQLAFAIIIPPWIVDKAFPGRLETVVSQAFEVAKKRNLAVYFSIETHYEWSPRSDLWNFFDPSQPGYDPDNKKNVEWIDWDGTPFVARDGVPHRYLDWGVPEKKAPHMCYNSREIESEIKRFTTKIIGPAVKKGIESLGKEGKDNLFAGITVGSEPSLDNYAALKKDSPLKGLREFVEKDGAPLVTLGYCALTNAGYSKENPPKNFPEALAKINQDFIALWAKNLSESGVPKNRMYTHIAAGADEVGSPILEFTNAPISVAFNDYSRPGWTTYPVGPLKDNFDVLYEQLADHGVTHWGGTEANPDFGAVKIPPYQYLKRHFDHGATVVAMNSGATGDLASQLDQGAWSKNAIAAYQRFLRGE